MVSSNEKIWLYVGIKSLKARIKFAFLLLLFCVPCFASGGACPTSATYGPNQNQTLSQAWGITSCYYIAANGSDSNSGLSETSPWLHAPGMPNCSGTCAAVNNGGNVASATGFIFRGGDTWHFGNSSAAPYTGGTWSGSWGTYANCNWQAANTGCIYNGVDPSWHSGSSWARPILTGDNSANTSTVSSCTYAVPTYSGGQIMINVGVANILDNFEVTGNCVSSEATVLLPQNTGNGGTGSVFLENDYIHGWTVTTGYVSGNVLGCVLVGGGANGLLGMDHMVIDGSDSNPNMCAWGAFPSFYHLKDSIVRYVTQGVGQYCHDIHDNIFEYFYPPLVNGSAGVTHGNIFECNDDNPGGAAYQPTNTPNVFYNNIIRHATTDFAVQGQVDLWFCPESLPEYWFNNIVYDVGNSNFWDIAGPPIYSCTNTGKQYMFNNTLVDGTQPCTGTVNSAGGQYLYVYNEHLINTPFATGTYSPCNGNGDASNVAMSDATATTQGYASTASRINTQNSSTSCANDNTTPCIPTSATSSTAVSAGHNYQSYCTTLAGYTLEPAIGADAANACQYDTTDACAYDSTTHTMSCPGQIAVQRPTEGAWNSGAYQFSAAAAGPNPPSGLSATVQ
jgi:hypothetical protein